MIKRETYWAAIVLGVSITFAGCGGGAASNVPKGSVSGVVTLDGKPLVGADVNFVSEEHSFSSYGKTDSEGRYTLAQGAAIGKNRVFFEKKETPDGFEEDPESGLDEGQFEAANFGETNAEPKKAGQVLIPDDFGPQKSKLTWDVAAGGTSEANFDLVTPK